jgi:uncharacterized repeat protein (TIGR03803 family)
MHSAGANGRGSISAAEPRFGSTKLAAIRCALTLAVFCALLLVAARSAQAQTETVLYNFTGGSDGAYPESSLTPDGKGNLYGTTFGGGSGLGYAGYGTVFELYPNGSGDWDETVLYTFTGGADGGNPIFSSLMFDKMGNLYGTAESGGGQGGGVVFQLSPNGTGWTETVLHSFTGGDDYLPTGGLIMDQAGNLYGKDWAYVFELSPSGKSWTEQDIYTPGSGAGGSTLAMDTDGNIYGTRYWTVFELSHNGSGGWNSTVIHKFSSGPPEGFPVLYQAGSLYGTTPAGGNPKAGTVYKLSPGKNGTWTYKTLYAFKGGEDGSAPTGIVFDAAGKNIYGNTAGGGQFGDGTVFELEAVGKTSYSYKEKVLWSFNSTDGSAPDGSPILDSAGNLYGTTDAGGSSEVGVVFEVTP